MSHGGGDSDMEAQAWPGFVDILSSTMIMFVFFLMITATALFFHTILFKSKLLSQNEQVVAQRVDKEVQNLVSENQALKQEISELKKQSAAGNSDTNKDVKLLQQATEFAASVEQEVKISSNNKELIVEFGHDAISLTENTNAELSKFLKPYEGHNIKIKITAGKPTGSNSLLTGRKVSVARMLNVRNLIIQSKINPQNVNAVIVEDTSVSDKSDWVKVVIEE